LLVREAIRKAGARNAGGTVQDVNSLRGACVVQGILAAIELRDRHPDLLITEAHPKALRWLLRDAQALTHDSEHQRDAHLAAITAWALVHSEPGWRDLYQGEPSFYSPIAQPLVYFMPVPTR
jgi:hypothetical protein